MGIILLLYAVPGFVAAAVLGFAAQTGLLGGRLVRTKSALALIGGWGIALLAGTGWSPLACLATAAWLSLFCMLFWEPGWMIGEALERGIARAARRLGPSHRH